MIFHQIPDKVALIFSTDKEVIDLYEEVALPLSTMLIAMNLSVLLERVPLSCGRTKVVLWTGMVGSWAAQVPAVLLCTQFYRNDLYGLFTGVTIGYCALDVLLLWVVYTTDWAFFAREASRRSEVIEVTDVSSGESASSSCCSLGKEDCISDSNVKFANKESVTTSEMLVSNRSEVDEDATNKI